MSRLKDLTNQKFGYLTVISRNKNPNNKRVKWNCVCECGNLTTVSSCDLVNGHTSSCGCKKFETRNLIHGMRHTRLYEIWCGMKKRCYNVNSKSYNYYGGKNIKMCDEWESDFFSFYTWSINNGYNENLTIDRIDVKGNYCPENCRWITHAEQQKNRTNTIYLTYKNETKSLSEWASQYGVTYSACYQRYRRFLLNNKPINFEHIFNI